MITVGDNELNTARSLRAILTHVLGVPHIMLPY